MNYLNGYVAARGREAGVKTPFNDAVVELYRSYGVGTLKPDPNILERLVRMLPR